MTRTRGCIAVFCTAVLALSASSARATFIDELVRIKGHEDNVLSGIGIVTGLDGTGDESKRSLVAARPYEQLLRSFNAPVASLDELAEGDSYALVMLRVRVPPTGIRSGDRLDVTVTTLFNATSLAGGQLFLSPLRVPVPGAEATYAFADGPIVIEGENPRRGRIRGGARMVQDIRTNPVAADGTMTLVLDDQYAGYPVANEIASTINDDMAPDGLTRVAVVEDAKNIRILLPEAERVYPAPFIAQLMRTNIDPSVIHTGPRITINKDTKTIAITGDVEVGPVLISHNNLTITSISPEPVPTPDDPAVRTHQWAELNTTGRGGTRLAELIKAFDQLNVPADDKIAIIHLLKETGKLYAEITYQ